MLLARPLQARSLRQQSSLALGQNTTCIMQIDHSVKQIVVIELIIYLEHDHIHSTNQNVVF